MDLRRPKEKIIIKKIKKRLQKNTESRNISNDKIQLVGILATKYLPYLDVFTKQLKQELNCKEVHVFLFTPFSKKEKTAENHFTNKDLNWKGNFTNQNIINFLNKPFSLLIGYFTEDNLYLKNAVLQSKANFKVGFSNKEQSLFELVINTELQNTTEFIIELKKYLTALQKIKI